MSSKPYRAIPAEEVFANFSPERQARIKRRSEELIAEELALRALRESKKLTQSEVARRLGGRQVYISRLEKRSDMKLSTLRDYVGAIGGNLHLMVTFPEGGAVRIKDIGEFPKESGRTRRISVAPRKARRASAGR